MNPVLASMFVSIGGALIRVFAGICKSKNIKKKFLWQYMLSTLAAAMLIGIVIGLILEFNWIISLALGYAGTDFLEGLYRGVIMKMPMGDR